MNTWALKEYFEKRRLQSGIEPSRSRFGARLSAFWRRWSRRNKAENHLRAASGSGDARSSANVDQSAERILIYRMGSMGDTIVALPCFYKIAEVFPNAQRYVLTNIPVSSKAVPNETILASTGLIHGVVVHPVGLRSPREVFDLARRLRALEARILIYLANSRGPFTVLRDRIFFRLCGIERIIGAPKGLGLRPQRLDASAGFVEPECEYLAGSIAALGPIDVGNRANWDLRLTDQEKAVGAETVAPFRTGPYIAINMGGKLVAKHWGDQNWRRLFADLARTHGEFGLLVVGSSEDAASVSDVTRDWPSPVVNACGRLAPRESAAAIENARLFIGHDSGPMHLAAACGVPCVALFGGGNPPGKWHPYGPGHRSIHHMDGIETILVEEVAAAVRESLAAGGAPKIKS